MVSVIEVVWEGNILRSSHQETPSSKSTAGTAMSIHFPKLIEMPAPAS